MAHQEIIQTMRLNLKKPEGSFYTAWILLTLLCVPVAFFLNLFLLGLISNFVGDFIYVNGVQRITEDYVGLYTFFPLAGLITGVVQYILLRGVLPRMGGWIPATVVGWMLGWILGLLPGQPDEMGLSSIDLLFLLMGLGIGVCQWLLLRNRLPRAGWWVVANLLGWALLALITTGNGFDQFGLFIMSLLPACTTAATLRYLLSQAPSTPTGE